MSAVRVTRYSDGMVRIGSVCWQSHHGNPREAVREALKQFMGDSDVLRVAVTGRKFRHLLNLSTIPEPEAVENALRHVNGHRRRIDAVVSAGGESFLVYVLTPEGRISSVQTGNKCASGTGEFFMQQLGRIGLSAAEAAQLGRDEKPYKVSGRCSVFCKSDCTHAMNKGVPKERIAAGLSEMMAGKILELMKQSPRDEVMLVGGAARNEVMAACLRKEIGRLTIPDEAPYFEALGTAVWALDHETQPVPEMEQLFRLSENSFSYLDPIENARGRVEFKSARRGAAKDGDRCILGLDVGSTTTKAVLIRIEDDGILASVYLRTKGDPVGASRACYEDLLNQLGEREDKVEIVGLGVTGSGRQIAGLHAMTDGVVNEIIAHATAALYYDPEVETIFEIGGQDAKYTYVKDGVPSDYAMNDACSAGTGSFLEEAAKEAMGLEMEEIGDMALRGRRPPNFNDQCAAFIGSDIKTAFQEGMEKEDIVAGLVYSICMNYSNRVKGNRPVGQNVFMQGGVCCNRAVPMAMAALTGKRIVVPPEPELMGAFGVALEIKRRLGLHLLAEKAYSLKVLKERPLDYGQPFLCRGGKDGCDRRCEIARIRIEGGVYPFGGACNRWYNLRRGVSLDAESRNLVRFHEELVFRKYADDDVKGGNGKIVGMNKSFTVNAYYPLYHGFFSGLGFKVVLPGAVDPKGIDRRRAPFCYPTDIAHGGFENLLQKNPDYLFLPQVKALYVDKRYERSTTCPISQGEPYYLASAFKDHGVFKDLREKKRVLMPVLDFSGGFKAAEAAFVETARSMGCGKKKARLSYARAVDIQERVDRERKAAGLGFLEALGKEMHPFAVVLFGRSYNAMIPEANMGIPHKFASRGVPVIPCDFLPLEDEGIQDRMYWSTGQIILKGASYVKRHPQLFGCFITNFSCGPDSFLLDYFRSIMGTKPFLILELDNHVADAGLETRIEAFLDIVRNVREPAQIGRRGEHRPAVRPAYFDDCTERVVDSRGRDYPLDHRRVHLLFPSMGDLLLEAAAAVFRSIGVRATALPPPDEGVLKLGRGSTSCKECLPLLLTAGTLLKYLEERQDRDELVLYFMPSASGPCRFGQYYPYIRQLLERREIEDVALFSLEAENSYTGVRGRDLTLRLWSCIVLSDVMQDIRSVLLANARDKAPALEAFRDQWRRMIGVLERAMEFEDLLNVLAGAAADLGRIPLRRPLKETPVILMTGEIYVRHDGLSRQFLVERLADRGFAVRVSGVTEWVYYTDWCYKNNLTGHRPGLKERTSLLLRSWWMRRCEKAIKGALAQSGLVPYRLEDVDSAIRNVRPFINPELTGEAVLTIGASVTEIPGHCCGAIAIGPFGCMPNRISEAILSREMGGDRERRGSGKDIQDLMQELPFLAIESDGNPFPQTVTAKLEVFLMQALRVHEIMRQGTEGRANG